jgi:hypothetical protein
MLVTQPISGIMMLFIATGTYTDPSRLAPLVLEEIKRVRALRGEGIIQSIYRRSDGSGLVAVLSVGSEEEGRERLGHLAFSEAGLIKFELAAIEPL